MRYAPPSSRCLAFASAVSLVFVVIEFYMWWVTHIFAAAVAVASHVFEIKSTSVSDALGFSHDVVSGSVIAVILDILDDLETFGQLVYRRLRLTCITIEFVIYTGGPFAYLYAFFGCSHFSSKKQMYSSALTLALG